VPNLHVEDWSLHGGSRAVHAAGVHLEVPLRIGRLIGACTVVLLLAGCPKQSPSPFPPEVPPPGPPAAPLEPAETATYESDITLHPLGWPQIEQLIASKRGKVTIVDIWSLSCIPCRREFPDLVALSRELKDDVACISVSTDPPRKQEQVLAFLEEHGATFDNVLCTENIDTLFDKILKIGSMPAVYVYDREGHLAKVFTGPAPGGEHYTYAAHVRPLVAELLQHK
jgi:thiol-disulfide isomerase/thioredoxin